ARRLGRILRGRSGSRDACRGNDLGRHLACCRTGNGRLALRATAAATRTAIRALAVPGSFAAWPRTVSAGATTSTRRRPATGILRRALLARFAEDLADAVVAIFFVDN